MFFNDRKSKARMGLHRLLASLALILTFASLSLSSPVFVNAAQNDVPSESPSQFAGTSPDVPVGDSQVAPVGEAIQDEIVAAKWVERIDSAF